MNFRSKYVVFLFFFLAFIVGGESFAMDLSKDKSSGEDVRRIRTVYIKQSGKSFINIKAHQLKVVSSLYIDVDVVGNGHLHIGADKKVSLNSHDCTIDNMVIDEGSVVELKGDLQINKHLLVQNAFLLLGDHDLIMTQESYAAFTSFDRIIHTGSGRILSRAPAVVHRDVLPVDYIPFQYHFCPCLMIETVKRTIPSNNISVSFRNLLCQIPFLDKETPPPKHIS